MNSKPILISKKQAKQEDWDLVRSWNYKLAPSRSVVYAELEGVHGEVASNDVERIYFIVEGEGNFMVGEKIINVQAGDLLVIPPHTHYDYKALKGKLKVVLFMELWDN